MSLSLVAVGIGNTSIKVGVTSHFGSSDPIWAARAEYPTESFCPDDLAGLLPATSARWRVASVQRSTETHLRDWVRGTRPADDYRPLTYRDLPIRVDVEFPERVGLDRLAAAVAANRLRKADQPAVVVDAGTAITVNLVTADGVFRGGVILPGFKLTARALAEGTDLLPLIDVQEIAEPPVIGRSTDEAIRSGLFWGSVGAVRKLVDRVSNELAVVPQVFVTGGDARRFTGHIAADARFIPDLVLIGIAACLD